MDAAEPKNDVLWGFIARSLYLGLITYVATAVVAFLLDYFRRYIINYGPRKFHPLRRLSKVQGFFKKYRGGSLHAFYMLEVFRFVLNLLVCVVYVHGTYLQTVSRYMVVIYGISSKLFLIDVVLRILATESAFSSVISLQILVDSFSYPSMWIAQGPNSYLNLAFLRAIALYFSYLGLERLLFIQMMSSRRLTLKLLVQNIVLFYTLAGAIQLLEIPGDLLPADFRDKWFSFGEWTYLNSCYFIIVTLSTVGYGDFSPSTVQGRIFTLIIIIIGIVIFASIVSELVEHARRGRGSGYFVKNKTTRHVIITGSPNRADLIQFITEFFADSRGTNKNAKAVVLVDEVKWSDTEWYQYIAKNYFLQNRVRYLHGSTGNALDLSRAGIESADAVFILSSFSNNGDPTIQDTETIMSALAIRNVRTDIPIYAQTLLENSSLQAYTALTTPSTFSKEETYFREKGMSKSAEYAGIYAKVLELEYETIPELQRKGQVLRRFEEQVNRYLAAQEDIRRNNQNAYGKDDLIRSQVVCLQEIQMALMSGNIRANGVGTLLSNMYLDVQSPKLSENVPAWMSEYHMGASCGLAYATVPKELDGVPIKDIAADLCQLGLLILAISDARNPIPKPVLNTNESLSCGDLVMVLTYHDPKVVATVLNFVALHYAKLHREDLVSALKLQTKSLGQLQSSRKNDSAVNGNKETTERHGLFDLPPAYASLLSNGNNHSGDDLDALIGQEELSDVVPQSKSANLIISKAEFPHVPNDLKGHVIIAPRGEAALDTMTLLLANLWRKDERKSLLEMREAKIVVVHPSISSEFRGRFSRFAGRSLFFVEGLPTSRATWRRARIDSARAVATTADYKQKGKRTDAQTLLTLLALDVVTKNDQNLFICSELVEERSLEYLREPLHPRRKGAILGSEAVPVPSTGDKESIHSREASKAAPATGPRSSSQEHVSVDSPDEGRQESVRQNLSNALHGGPSQQAFVNLKGIIPDNRIDVVPKMEGDPAARPGAARARRSVLFSRSRYASGELLVQSNSISLLAREYIEPGFINLFTNILGINSQNPGMKIRLIRIPPSLFRPDIGTVGSKATKFVQYEKIFNALIRIGVTPLGIYRSGVAPALLPSKPRNRRGTAVSNAYIRLANEILSTEEETVVEKAAVLIRMKQFLRRVIGTVQEVLPHRIQEKEGRNEVNGQWNDETQNNENSFPSDADTSSENDENGTSHNGNDSNSRDQSSRISGPNGNGPVDSSNEESRRVGGAAPSKPETLKRVLGHLKYSEQEVKHNLLPYVYTFPDLNTLCARADGVYVLCHPCFDLPSNWSDTFDDVNKPEPEKDGGECDE